MTNKKVNVKDLMLFDRTSLDIHWTSFVSRYNDFQAWLNFMVADGNIQQETYKMMEETLSMMFDRYKDLWDRFDKIIPDDDTEIIEKE